MELKLIKQERFYSVTTDFYQDLSNEDILMTREQIGLALEYGDPQKAISNIHLRHKDRLDKFSVVLNLRATDEKFYPTTLYTVKGVYEICRWSKQKLADEFMDFVWNIVDAYRTGKLVPKEVQPKPNQAVQEYLVLSEEERAIAFFTQKLENKKLEQHNTEMKPKAEAYDCFISADSLKSIEVVAKSLFNGKGRNKLYAFLRDIKILQNNNLPYQQYIDRGYFEVKQRPKKMGSKMVDLNQTFVTPKGIDYVRKLCIDNGFTV